MLGYDYEIIYNKGKGNVVENSLSLKYEEEGSLFALSLIIAHWLNDICKEWLAYPKITNLIQQLQMEFHAYMNYTWQHEEVRYKGCLYLNKQRTFKSKVLSELHSSPTVGHS
jgi:hypothetical protein